jgi:hypothetical protein
LNESATDITTATRTFQIYNQNLEAASDATVIVSRYYSSCNCYLDVWSRKTDSSGQAIGQFETIDAFYKYRVLYNDEIKYTSGDEGTQWSTSGTTDIFISTTPGFYNDFQSLEAVEYAPITFTNTSNTTGYFTFTYSYTSTIDVCLEVQESSYIDSSVSETCVESSGSTIFFPVNHTGVGSRSYLARAKVKVSDNIGYQTVDTKSVTIGQITNPTSTLWIYNMTWISILLTMTSLLLYIKKSPKVALVFQATTFLILVASPIKFVNMAEAYRVTAGVVAFFVVLFIIARMKK